MKILVTGAAGYIGSHTCVELLEAGYDVIALDNYSNSHPEALRRVSMLTGKSFSIIYGDLKKEDEVDHVFKTNNIAAVIHLAAYKAVSESVNNPLDYYENNLLSTINLLKIMNKYCVKKMVFSSSATVYGEAIMIPIREDAPFRETSPYGRTKQMTEKILNDLYKSDSEWSIAILRYFNPVGAHSSGYIGEDPNGIPNNLLPYITQVAIGRRPVLKVYGNDYDTVDGTGVRDYIHISDLATGHLKSMQYVLKKSNLFEVYNLGTGKGYSVLQMIKAFEEASQKKIPIIIADRRPGDIATCYAHPEKAIKELGWKAKKGVKEICEDSWRWQYQNPSGYLGVKIKDTHLILNDHYSSQKVGDP